MTIGVIEDTVNPRTGILPRGAAKFKGWQYPLSPRQPCVIYFIIQKQLRSAVKVSASLTTLGSCVQITHGSRP